MGRKTNKKSIFSQEIDISDGEVVELLRELVKNGYEPAGFIVDDIIEYKLVSNDRSEIIVSKELVFVRGSQRTVRRVKSILKEFLKNTAKKGKYGLIYI